IDTVILGCTHYPLLIDKIHRYMPGHVTIVQQGEIVAHSLADYLRRHPEMECRCSQGGSCRYLTTEDASRFGELASIFVREQVEAHHITL
ncbi:MAG: aspartate/glutamate racemase family protein, partial [Muribaculaceae bacterium]|nr:aspartate/glutamate racemase family protein [Muribaculaceae bacterium]